MTQTIPDYVSKLHINRYQNIRRGIIQQKISSKTWNKKQIGIICNYYDI